MKKNTRSNGELLRGEQITRETYNLIAKKFAETRIGKKMWGKEYALFFSHLPQRPRILDLGCGEGGLLSYIVDNNIPISSYLGIDYSEGLLQEARSRHEGALSENIRFQQGLLQEGDWSEKKVDVIFMIASFHHLLTTDTQLQCLKQCKEALKPNGMICMTNWKKESMMSLKKCEPLKSNILRMPFTDNEGQRGDRFYYGFEENTLHDLAEQAGLKIHPLTYSDDYNIIMILGSAAEARTSEHPA